jgi:hypothetical protein
MTIHYLVARGETRYGPFSAAELRALAASGQLRPTDSVWQQGTQLRVPAARVKGLFSAPPAEAPPAEEAAAPPPEAPEEKPPEAPEEKPPPPPPQAPKRPKRVVSITGGVLCSQDGTYVQFRKKCEKCGYTDPGRTNTVIRPGSMKIPFFCRKCRKGRMVQMTAVG